MKDLGQQNTVSSFLVQQLYDLGVRHVFGVPGDYVLGFYQYLNESKKLMHVEIFSTNKPTATLRVYQNFIKKELT